MTINKEQAVSDAFFYVEWIGEPCPFCGESGVSGKSPENHFFAGCPDPDCIAHNLAYDFVTVDHARAAWNARASHPLEQQQAVSGDVECEMCDDPTNCPAEQCSFKRAALTASGVGRMREILEPLAEKAKRIDDSVYWTERRGDGFTVAIPLGVCRKARTALQGGE